MLQIGKARSTTRSQAIKASSLAVGLVPHEDWHHRRRGALSSAGNDHTMKTAPLALLVALAACTARHTDDGGDDGVGGSSTDAGASGFVEESTDEGGGSATSSDGTSAMDGSTGSNPVCVGEPFDVDGWWVSGCCDAPLPEVTCSAWCEVNGFGDCLFLHTTSTGHCEPYGSGINQLGLCDVDLWTYLPPESIDGLVVRCVCDAP
jgi:hypothetical protein